jgi:hypothetical protein
MENFFLALDAAYGILVPGGLSMIAFTHKEMKAARVTLMIAAVVLSFRWLMWGFVTDTPWWGRSLVGAVVGALVLGGLPAVWMWSKERETPAPSPGAPISATTPPPRSAPAPQPASPTVAAPVPSPEAPLPPSAIFRYRGAVFWAAPRRYTKDEAKDMRAALREVYDA